MTPDSGKISVAFYNDAVRNMLGISLDPVLDDPEMGLKERKFTFTENFDEERTNQTNFTITELLGECLKIEGDRRNLLLKSEKDTRYIELHLNAITYDRTEHVVATFCDVTENKKHA